MLLHTAKVVHAPGRTFVQSATFYPPEEQSLERGILVVSLTIENLKDHETELSLLAEDALETLKSTYFSSTEPSQLVALRKAVEAVAQKLVFQTEFEMVASVFWEQYAYFCTWNEAKVLLWREQKFVPLLVGKSENVGSCSGKVGGGDTFVLATSGAKNLLNTQDFANFFKEQAQLQVLAETITTDVYEKPLSPFVLSLAQVENEEAQQQAPQAEAPLHAQFSTQSATQPKKGILVKIAELLPESVNIHPEKSDGVSRQKTAVLIGIILLALLGLSIVFGIQQKGNKEKSQEFKSQLVKANVAYEDALLQKDVNPSQARELFNQAKTIVETLTLEKVQDPGLEELKAKIERDKVEILGRVEATPSTYLDLSLVREGLEATQIVLEQDKLFVLDQVGHRIISVSAVNKETTVLGGSDKLSSVIDIAAVLGRVYVLSDGIVRVREATVDTAIPQDDEWGSVHKIVGFGGNLYLLDKGGKIWRYSDTSGSFGTKSDWLKESIDLTGAKDFLVDGYIWVLEAQGDIKKIARGKEDPFTVKGLVGDLNGAVALFSDETLESLYILDKTNKRIVEIDKSGNYKKEYVNELIGEVVDIVVSSVTQKIFLLTPQKILELPLK